MLVYNNATKDDRVMKEAESLQSAGHEVTVVGIPDNEAKVPLEYLPNGVRIVRSMWQARAYTKLLISTVLRTIPLIAIAGLLIWGLFHLIVYFLGEVDLSQVWGGIQGLFRAITQTTLLEVAYVVAALLVAAVLFYVGSRAFNELFRLVQTVVIQRRTERETVLRYSEELLHENLLEEDEFPKIKSRIPGWVPDVILEFFLGPASWFMGEEAVKFALYRFRSQAIADLVIRLKPDVVHCHDCPALPTGAIIKRRLGIPLVYDAHEIYEAAATRIPGITEYYARVHRNFLGYVDLFITINDSAALYYRRAYPKAKPAIVIRNATRPVAPFTYDGRLHDAAEIPRSQKILLYQGGFTKDRGLPTVVRSAQLLPKGWTLIMLGWGPLSGELKQIAAGLRSVDVEAKDETKIRFIQRVPRQELHLWSAGAAVGIIPYENKMLNHWICTPNKLWEFPTAGVPLLVQPFPELRKVVEQYHCGWLLPESFTSLAIAEALEGLTDEMIAEAREGCARFVEADNWTVVYEKRLRSAYMTLDKKRVGQPSKAEAAVPSAATT